MSYAVVAVGIQVLPIAQHLAQPAGDILGIVSGARHLGRVVHGIFLQQVPQTIVLIRIYIVRRNVVGIHQAVGGIVTVVLAAVVTQVAILIVRIVDSIHRLELVVCQVGVGVGTFWGGLAETVAHRVVAVAVRFAAVVAGCDEPSERIIGVGDGLLHGILLDAQGDDGGCGAGGYAAVVLFRAVELQTELVGPEAVISGRQPQM